MISLWLKYIKIYKHTFDICFFIATKFLVHEGTEVWNYIMTSKDIPIKFDFSSPYIIIGLINTKFVVPKLFSNFLHL